MAAAPLSGVAAHAAGAATPARHSSGRELDAPSGLAFGGGRLWVTNQGGNSVSALNPRTGRWIRTYRAAPYGFNSPTAIVDAGANLFVTNASGSVTELRATSGALVRRISGHRYGFADPVAVTAAGGTLLVLDAGRPGAKPVVDGSITEVAAGSGRLLRRVGGARFGFDHPAAMTVSGADVFVADAGNDTVTEVNVKSGRLVRRITGGGLSGPDGIAAGRGHIWVADSGTSAATEIDAGSGRVLATFSNSNADYGFGNPSVTMAYGGNVFVATPLGTSPMVTKLSATTGAPSWYMCNTNGPYYFSQLSAFAFSGHDLWVASRSGANNPKGAARTGSLTEMLTTTGGLIRTLP